MSKDFKISNPKPGDKNIQMIGERFGMLIVLDYSHLNEYNNRIWECKCDCGNLTYVSTTQLRSGKTTSCKCNQYKKGDQVHNYSGYKDITGSKWNSIINNAKTRGLDFNISKEAVWALFETQNKKCVLSGLDISFEENTASIDRIKNDIGYELNNIQLVHKDINIMRNKFSVDYYKFICSCVASNIKN